MSKALCSGGHKMSGVQKPGVDFQLSYSLANDFLFLDLSFHICKMGLHSSVISGPVLQNHLGGGAF